jgi:hypothetical protein
MLLVAHESPDVAFQHPLLGINRRWHPLSTKQI